jgi:hypothetical protein
VDEFKAAVDQHIKNLHEFNRTIGKPRPTAHPLVEACIKRTQVKGKPDTYTADYEIIHDKIEPTLEDKKNVLMAKLHEAENKALDAIYPPRKRRLLGMQHNDLMKISDEDRTQEHKDLAQLVKDLDAKYTAINFKAAEAAAAIEDLTEDNIDSWQVPTF